MTHNYKGRSITKLFIIGPTDLIFLTPVDDWTDEELMNVRDTLEKVARQIRLGEQPKVLSYLEANVLSHFHDIDAKFNQRLAKRQGRDN